MLFLNSSYVKSIGDNSKEQVTLTSYIENFKTQKTSSVFINVLSKELQLLIEIIDKIEAKEIQREYLLKLKELID